MKENVSGCFFLNTVYRPHDINTQYSEYQSVKLASPFVRS